MTCPVQDEFAQALEQVLEADGLLELIDVIRAPGTKAAVEVDFLTKGRVRAILVDRHHLHVALGQYHALSEECAPVFHALPFRGQAD